MTGIEITLLLIGIIFMIGSFFITEKLSGSDLNKVSEVSEEEIKKILERELDASQQKIKEQMKESMDASVEEIDRALEKETNEKIMAISEFSDTVMENMNKTHNEITFLYSMLNDKHSAMTHYADELQELVKKLEEKKEEVKTQLEEEANTTVKPEILVREEEQNILKTEIPTTEKKETAESEETGTKEAEADEVQMEEVTEPIETKAEERKEPEEEKEPEMINHNARILELHKAGYSDVEIAKELGLGTGEVRLVLGLFREEEAE